MVWEGFPYANPFCPPTPFRNLWSKASSWNPFREPFLHLKKARRVLAGRKQRNQKMQVKEDQGRWPCRTAETKFWDVLAMFSSFFAGKNLMWIKVCRGSLRAGETFSGAKFSGWFLSLPSDTTIFMKKYFWNQYSEKLRMSRVSSGKSPPFSRRFEGANWNSLKNCGKSVAGNNFRNGFVSESSLVTHVRSDKGSFGIWNL